MYGVARKVVKTFLREPSYQKCLEFSWGDMVDILADQVDRNREINDLAQAASAPLSERSHAALFRPYNQMPCTRETAVKRVGKALDLVGFDEPILLLGDDDMVSVELAAAGFRDVTAVDIDDKVLDEIARRASEQGVRVRRKQHDLSQPVPRDLYKDYKLVLFDPCYTVPSVKMFLEGALEMARNADGTYFFVSVHLMSLLRRGLPDLEALIAGHGLELLEFHQGFNTYPAPQRLKSLIHLVNQIVIGSKTLATEGYGFPYFLSDALLLRKT